MVPSSIVCLLSLVASGDSADWITLDGGGILLILVSWALAGLFALGGVVLAASASFPQPPPGRAKRARQAVVCFALAALVGFGMPLFLDTMSRETSDALASWALVWAPALVGVGALFVRQVGRLS
jgi:hypothetical protein